MRDRKTKNTKSQAISETTAGRGFIVWMAAWALLTLSLFIFHGAHAHGTASGKVAHNDAAPGLVIEIPDSSLPTLPGPRKIGS